eukprot:817723-Amphidinium_carterae.1
MAWIRTKWTTGQMEQASAEKPGLIRFLGLNLEVVTVKNATRELPAGTVIINQLEYVAEVLAKLDDQFMLKSRNSAGDAETFGMTQQSTQQMQADYAASTKKGLNLAAVAGSLNWVALRSRPDISWAVSRAARLVSRNPALAFYRFRHIAQFLRWTLDYGM